eukprot:NODE_5273_length_1788_cov_10.497893.p1 GENE.NODE_5273_length_1788_cov_10.497893~~NODE_5273_length_1788_cov_10.497893.p1  ORF type:complete len:307 (-),score=85.10 NODE_5273_length_1788_cov_10.497893:287-1207(-)
MWLVPLFQFFAYSTPRKEESSKEGSLFPLLRMLRLLRILRLLKLLRTLRPLYKLTVGVLAAVQAMQWVLVFTATLLYGSGILFRSVIGNGLVAGVNAEARMTFPSVPQSMFHLFRLMNGLTPADCLIATPVLKVLYMVFLVLSNWAVLAILTAVVSDNMMLTQQEHEKQEEKRRNVECQMQSTMRLKKIFMELDKDSNGILTEGEFQLLLANEALRDEMCEATDLDERDLRDLFSFLSLPDVTGGQSFINYNDFVEKVQREGSHVSERSVFRVEKHLKVVEHRFDKKVSEVQACLQTRARLPPVPE